MEAVILAGGLGTRLQEAVPDLPKVMAPVAGRPFLEVVLRSLARKGFGHAVLSVGYRADLIMSHFGSTFLGMHLDYAREASPLGTGGGTRLALAMCRNDHAFVFNGDTYLDVEADQLESQWSRHCDPIIVGRRVPDVARYGSLVVSGERVVGFSEKGMAGPGLVNAGCYLLGVNHLDKWPLEARFSLEKDYLPDEVARGRVRVFETSGLFIDIGVPDDYRRAQSLLAGVE